MYEHLVESLEKGLKWFIVIALLVGVGVGMALTFGALSICG